jgi:hypothetical protein
LALGSRARDPLRLSLFGYAVLAVVGGAALSAIAAGILAIRRRGLFLEDFGTVFLVPLAFRVVGMLRSDLHVGFALIFWPIIVAVLCMYLFSIKVMLVDRGTQNGHRNSRLLFFISLAVVVTAALTVPPWYE